jgi:hypothetical protein
VYRCVTASGALVSMVWLIDIGVGATVAGVTLALAVALLVLSRVGAAVVRAFDAPAPDADAALRLVDLDSRADVSAATRAASALKYRMR